MVEPGDRYWELRAAEVDPALFFRILPSHFPEATTLFFEGTAFAADVLRFLRDHGAPGEFTPGANTLWPESTKIRCRFSRELTDGLALLAEHHASPELCDHLFLYREDDFLLYWHDAFDNTADLAPGLPSDRVASFAKALGCTAARVEPKAG
jgi:hypothetical protein